MTNQTIDRVPGLRALLAEIYNHHGTTTDHRHRICALLMGAPAAQFQGDIETLRAALRTEVEAGDSWKREAQELREKLEGQPQGEPFGYWLFPKGLPLHGMFHRVTASDKIIDSQSVVAAFDITPLYAEQPAQVAHTMKTVMAAICSIDGFPMLTSNQCHALAVKLNACLDEVKRLNP